MVAAAGLRPVPASAATSPSVIIVGAGLAGIRAAHWLHRVKGITATIYEGSTRAGGRCWSLRDYFDDGAVVEHGGQLINTDHNAIRNLISSLGLNTVAANGGAYAGWQDKYSIDGADYPYDAANADWGQVQSAMKADLQSAPYPQTYSSNTPAGIELDRMTVNEWLAARVPGGLDSRFAKLMQSNVIAEYGMDPDQQSALNLVYLLGWNPKNSLDPLNGADEKYVVEGGNDQIVSRMLAELPAGTVKYGNALTALRANANGSVTGTFLSGRKYTDVTADRIILALPFTTLRDADLSRSGFSALKLRAIRERGWATTPSLHIQLSSRPWVARATAAPPTRPCPDSSAPGTTRPRPPRPVVCSTSSPVDGRPGVEWQRVRPGAEIPGGRLPLPGGRHLPRHARGLHRAQLPGRVAAQPVVEGGLHVPHARAVHHAVRCGQGA